MPFKVELPPISQERLRATAEWIYRKVHPVANLVHTEDGQPVPPFEVRDHQVEVLARQWQAREEGRNRILGHLATGGGKTTDWAIDEMKYREECAQLDVPMVPRSLYVSPKHEINKQAAKRLLRFMPDADISFFDTKKADSRPEADFTFATIQSLHSKLHTFDPEDFENIFWDEAHHLEAKTFKAVLEYFRPLFESAATATIERMDGKDIRDYWGEVIYSKGLPDGIAEGWLADVDYHIIFDKAVKEEVAKGFHPKTLKEIEELFKKKVSAEALAESIREEISRLGLEDPKMMIFCESIEEANEMAELLGGKSYHTYSEDTDQILSDLKSGKIRVVTARDKFNEGVDVPDVEVIVFLRATKSGPLFEQQLGRGLRRIAGKDRVHVLDFVANIERIAKVRELSGLVQRHAHECGDEEAFEETVARGGGGLTVRSKHSEFDFDSVAVDLLERWERLRLPDAPDGYMSLNEFTTQHGISYRRAHRLIEELGIEVQSYLYRETRAFCLSPDQQLELYVLLSGEVSAAPKDVVSVRKFAKQQGFSDLLVLRAASELKQKLSIFRFGPTPGQALDNSQQKMISEYLLANFPIADADTKTIAAFAKEEGVSYMSIGKLIGETNMELKRYRFKNNNNNTIAVGLTLEDQKRLREFPLLSTKRITEGSLTVCAFASLLGVSPKTLKRLIAGLGMQVDTQRTSQGGFAAVLNLEQQALLKEQPAIKHKVPEGYKSVSGFAKVHQVDLGTMNEIIANLELNLNKYSFNGHMTFGLSPNDQRSILFQLAEQRT